MTEHSISEKSPKFIRYGLDFMEKTLDLIIKGQGVVMFRKTDISDARLPAAAVPFDDQLSRHLGVR